MTVQLGQLTDRLPTTLFTVSVATHYTHDTMAQTAGYTHKEEFDSGDLQVSDLHRIHYVQYGEPNGKTGKTIFPTRITQPD
jgi:hypothetical protein